MRRSLRGLVAIALLAGCGGRDGTATNGEPGEPGTIRLVAAFRPEAVLGSLPLPAPPPPTTLRFDGAGVAFEAGPGVDALGVHDGRLTGRVTKEGAALRIALPAPPAEGDFVHDLELRMRASAGRTVHLEIRAETAFEPVLATPRDLWSMTSPLVPGDSFRTYTLRGLAPIASANVKQLFLAPSDAAGATFEIESRARDPREGVPRRDPLGPGLARAGRDLPRLARRARAGDAPLPGGRCPRGPGSTSASAPSRTIPSPSA